MKKYFYIVAFGVLGFLLATVVHAVVELVALSIIFGNPDNAESILWREWSAIHSLVSTLLWTVGTFLGLYLGDRWWEQYGSRPGAFAWRKRPSAPERL